MIPHAVRKRINVASRRKPKTLDQMIRVRVNKANYTAGEHGLDERLIYSGISTVPEVCPFCGKPLGVKELSLDHIIPFSKGGRNVWSNIQWTCRKCNRYRSNLSVKEYGNFIATLITTGFDKLFFSRYRPRSFRAYRR